MKWGLAAILVLLLVGGIGLVAAFVMRGMGQAVEPLQATAEQCRTGDAVGRAITVLIDRSDNISPAVASEAFGIIRDQINLIGRPITRVALFELHETVPPSAHTPDSVETAGKGTPGSFPVEVGPGGVAWCFDRTQTEDAAGSSYPSVAAPDRTRQWLNAVETTLLGSRLQLPLPKSPILDTLDAIGKDLSTSMIEGESLILVYSDMLENTEEFSISSGNSARDERAGRTGMSRDFRPRLVGADVRIGLIAANTALLGQICDFWDPRLKDAGARQVRWSVAAPFEAAQRFPGDAPDCATLARGLQASP